MRERIPTRRGISQTAWLSSRWAGWAAAAMILAALGITWTVFSGIDVRFWSGLVGLSALFALPIASAADRYRRYAFILPASVILFGLSLVPVVFVLVISLTDSGLGVLRGKFRFIGLSNFVSLLTGDADARNAMVRTVAYVFTTVVVETVLGLALALLIHRKTRASNTVTTMLLVPMMSTPIVIALIWRTLFSFDDGLLNRLLAVLGIQGVPWLSGTALPILGDLAGKSAGMFGLTHGFLSAEIVDVWQWTPFLILIFVAGLKTVPQELYEAGEIDGASRWQLFWYITLPQIASVMAIGIALRVVDAFKTFETIWALFGNTSHYRTLSVDIFTRAIETGRFGEASAESVLLLVLSMLMGFGVLAWSRREAGA